MKVEFDLISKKKEFQDKTVTTFQASKEYLEEQAKYRVVTYIECLDHIQRELQAKGVDSVFLVITKMRKPFSSPSTPISL